MEHIKLNNAQLAKSVHLYMNTIENGRRSDRNILVNNNIAKTHFIDLHLLVCYIRLITLGELNKRLFKQMVLA